MDGDVLLGHHAADDLVDELVALASLLRVHVDDRVTVLAATAGLADELALGVHDLVARTLAIGNLGLAHVRLDLELAQQAVDDDLEVQLAHAGDDGLAGLVVGGHAERRVLLGELLQSDGHLVLLGLGLGLHGDVDNRIGELHGLQDDRERPRRTGCHRWRCPSDPRRQRCRQRTRRRCRRAGWSASAADGRCAPSCPSMAFST